MDKKICFTGGGTAGHVFPGLAVIDSLCLNHRFKKDDFIWIGSSSGMEKAIVSEAGISFRGILSGKLRRYFSFRNFTDIFKIVSGFFQAFFLFLRERPSLVFSKGGYVSVPPAAAGKLMGIPVMTHESDFTPGLATKINSVFADKIIVSSEETLKYIKPAYRKKTVTAGNPVRKGFFSGDAERGRRYLGIDGKKPLILVLGGSQGSGEINRLIYAARKELAEKYHVIHQTGAGADIKRSDLPGYIQIPFIKEELPDVIAAASVTVSRAGAGALWELSAEGKPAILIPLRGSGTRGDQIRNSDYFKSRNAAIVLNSPVIEPDNLLKAIEEALRPERAAELSENIAGLTDKNSADMIADEIARLLKERNG